MDFADIENEVAGKDNMGGIQTILLYGDWDDVATFPALPDIATATLDTAATVDGSALAMATGKMMNQIYNTQDSSGVDFEEQGELDGKSVISKLEIFAPGLQKKILGFWRGSNNANLFFIAPDNNGIFYLIGNDKFPAKRAGGNGTTGKATGDRKGATLMFQAPSVSPIIITLTQADIDRLTVAAT